MGGHFSAGPRARGWVAAICPGRLRWRTLFAPFRISQGGAGPPSQLDPPGTAGCVRGVLGSAGERADVQGSRGRAKSQGCRGEVAATRSVTGESRGAVSLRLSVFALSLSRQRRHPASQQQDPSGCPERLPCRAVQGRYRNRLGTPSANPHVRVLSRWPPWRAVACDRARYLCAAGRDAIKASAGGMRAARAPTGASRAYVLPAFC